MAVVRPEGSAIRQLSVEALGDDFALLSGEWFDSPRVAQFAKDADRIWAFSALTEEDAGRCMDWLPQVPGRRIVGIAPGVQPGWGKEGRETVLRLLDVPAAEHAIVGLLFSVEDKACPCPHKTEKNSGCAGGCGGCQGTKTACGALYTCNKKQQF